LIAASVLTAATFSSTVAGLAITGSLGKAFATSPPVSRPVSPPVSGPVSKDQCKNGGWQSFGFKSQGQCVSFVRTGGKHAPPPAPLTLADLDTSIAGTVSFPIISVTNLDGNAAGVAGTETLETNLSIGNAFSGGSCPDVLCVPLSGTFTTTTSVGTLNGTATGVIDVEFIIVGSTPQGVPVAGGLTLTVTSATGQFTGTTGTLNVALTFPTLGSNDFTGTVTG
jgi:hypothetical protein